MSLRLIARSFANTQMRLVLPATSATARVATRHISFFGGKEEGKAPADGAQPAAAAAPGQPEPTEQEKLISKQAEEIASLTVLSTLTLPQPPLVSRSPHIAG
eukprot:m.70338 g.70338  ORF g.70338 m.70338 type:complete len:102 (+) comp50130_c0_seq2:167-472(+)